jgi:competence protein ComEC
LKSDRRLLIVGFLTLVIFLGAFYASAYQYLKFEKSSLVFNQKTELSGTVVSYPRTAEKTKGFEFLTVAGDLISVRTNYYQQSSYGDRIILNGTIKPLSEKTDYLKKDGVIGTLDYPKVISQVPTRNFSLKKVLFSVRDSFTEVYKKTLNREESALMSGILLGQESADFPSDFKQAMKNSGTTHITALSGYNITILISALFLVLGFFMSRNASFWVSMGAIILFVLMTGAQSSVVRAAFMGSLVIIARQLSRIYSFRQAMAASAFLMVLSNPMVLRFDVGFLLSFLSLAGITYIAPTIGSFLVSKKEWLEKVKKLFLETLSAQAAVLPVLVVYFGGFSAVGVIANVLVLPLIPVTMGIGFFAGLAGIFWLPLAKIVSLLLVLPLKLEVAIINFFGSFPQIQIEFGAVILAIYYAALFLFVLKYYRRLEAEKYAV